MSVSTGVRAYPLLSEADDLFRRGLNDEASFKVIQHLREHRDEPRGLALLGEIAMETGALVQAEQFLRRAIALGFSSPAVELTLATAILHQDRFTDALEIFRRLEPEVDDPQITSTIASILDKLGRTDEALEAHERLVARVPGEARYWILYGHSLRFAGRTDEAIAAYRRVVESDPERGEAWWSLADIKSKVLTDADIETMQSALSVAVDMLNIVPLHMALGRGWHDRADYSKAFGHYRQGNRLRAETIRYDPGELTQEVDEFIRMAPAAPIQAPTGPTPIFLVSLPRSGSTLLEQILSRHPQIEATGELPHIRAIMRGAMELRMRHRPITVPQFIRSLRPDEKQALGADYLRRAAQHRRTDAPFFIDKMPANWSDILFINAILPQARFIEIRRDPMDCCFSNYTHHFGSAHAASFDLVHQARSCVDYTRLMDHVRSAAPSLMCSVRYEELVDEPEPVLLQVLAYLALEWDPALLSFYESDRTVRTPSAEQVRRPLNRSGIGAWKPYAQWLGPLRDTLGPLARD